MRSEWIAAQIFAIVCQLTGAYLIGDWRVVFGVYLSLWGYGVMVKARRWRKGPHHVKDWLGNQHVE
jgi:hypothetical protein